MPAALSMRIHKDPERIPCGVPALDALFQGGLSVGVLTELVGAECSGRTSMALTYVAATMRRGNVCAWIDIADALDPETVAANGVDLERLLWVRCGTEPRTPDSGAGVVVSRFSAVADPGATSRTVGGGSAHPRSEGRNMPEAIASMMRAESLPEVDARRRKKILGTPGAPNRPIANRSGEREEQANSDRLPARRGDNLALFPRTPEPTLGHRGQPSGQRVSPVGQAKESGKPWQALDQALRITDLLLQGGGFSTLVLDMGSIPPEVAWRVPMATWFRFRAACERSQVSLLMLTQHSCARSGAALVVRMETGSMEAQGNLMTGIRYASAAERGREMTMREIAIREVPMRKPPQSARHARPGEWASRATWMEAK